MTDMSKSAAAPKQKISNFRRALWHVNRTDLGWVTKAVMGVLNNEDAAQRRKLLDALPTDPRWAQATRELRSDGYTDVSGIVSRSLAEAVAAVADEKLARAADLANAQKLGHKAFWVSLLDEDTVDGAYPADHTFVRYALQPSVLRILGDFMGTLPRLVDVLLTLSQPTEKKLSYSQLWHLDHDDKRVCKLFIYLTDVTTNDDGPFTFMPAGPSRRFRNTLKSHLTDEQVFSKSDRADLVEMIAPRLSSFIVNTARCLHMGSRIAPGHKRLLYTATFIQPPSIYPDSKPRFRATAPPDELTRAVLRLT